MIMKRVFTIIAFITVVYNSNGQLQLNEVQITNGSTLADEDSDYTDWIELYNAGNTTVDLSQYYLSDKLQNPMQWQLPDLQLDGGERFLVHASAKDRRTIVDHYETLVYPWSSYSYLVPQIAPPTDWNAPGFDDSGWGVGNGGIGYGDGDDGTDLGGPSISCFNRTIFNIDNPEAVTQVILQIDFDDSFIAYLNGYEFARYNIGTPGIAQHSMLLPTMVRRYITILLC
jgi:Lamin Tail Domain